MSVNQTIDASKMLGSLELANPVTVTSESGVLTLTADSNSFVAEGAEAITSITGVDQGMYVITWNTARTLTYSASALVLVGQADKTTAIGDVGVYQINSGVVTELLYQPVAGYGDFSASLVTNGYQKLPSGLIIQWGQNTSEPSGSTLYSFPIAFPNAVFVGFAEVTSSVSADITVRFIPKSKSQFMLDCSYSSNLPAYWMAIGY